MIVNAAAHTAVDKAESRARPGAGHQRNGARRAGREAAALGAWLVHYSTDYVFDGTGTTPWTEDDHDRPAECLRPTKLEGEQLDPRQRLPAPDPAHQLGVRGARPQFRAHHAAARRRTRRAHRHRRPARRADGRRPACRRYRPCAESRAAAAGAGRHLSLLGRRGNDLARLRAATSSRRARTAGLPIRVAPMPSGPCLRPRSRPRHGVRTIRASPRQAAQAFGLDAAGLDRPASTACWPKFSAAERPDATTTDWNPTMQRKGIILAGGSGTRLHPATLVDQQAAAADLSTSRWSTTRCRR